MRSEASATLLDAQLEAAQVRRNADHTQADEQIQAVTEMLKQGLSRSGKSVDPNLMPNPPDPSLLIFDSQQGLALARQDAQKALEGVKDGSRDLMLWLAKRSSIMGGLGIGFLAVLALAIFWVTRQYLQEQSAVATATQKAVVMLSPSATSTNTRTITETATPNSGVNATLQPSTTNTPQARSTSTLRTNTPRPSPTLQPTATTGPAVGPVAMTIGRTSLGTPVEAVRFGNGPETIIFIGGLHAGFAPGTVALARQAVRYFTDNPEQIPSRATVFIIISASPDTPNNPGELPGRLNSNGVDANRNWGCRWTEHAKWRNEVVRNSGGTAPFSEPEVKSLADFIQNNDASAVVFWEARAVGGLVSPGGCYDRVEVSSSLARTYGRAVGYRVGDFEEVTNQELNGDSTNWLDSVGIPAIAVLLPRYETTDWDNNLKGILAVLEAYGR
jgi:hypothetical protein